ncbi:hypothetical protein ACQGSY_28755, partial [Bacillus cereus]|uniref:hypothetical protein n=1 Tax=Bacillus cereus TaxID=1396 RepID=UPI003CF1ECDE
LREYAPYTIVDLARETVETISFLCSVEPANTSAFAFASRYRIIKDLYQDACTSSDALFEPIH